MGILKQHVEHYRNQWMVQIPAGLEAAKKIAENEGFILEREVIFVIVFNAEKAMILFSYFF